MSSSVWFALSVLIGVSLGVLSARILTSDNNELIVRQSGAWQHVPQAGVPGGNPYLRARFLLRNELPEHFSEVSTFFTSTDSSGDRLSLECTYKITVERPDVRRWSLSSQAAPGEKLPLVTQNDAISVDGVAVVRLSQRPQPGHWLWYSRTVEPRLIFRLYNADPVAAGVYKLPPITRESCE